MENHSNSMATMNINTIGPIETPALDVLKNWAAKP
jgi:hypothetical protein